MNYCPKCGTSVSPDSKFCMKCGEPLNNKTSEIKDDSQSFHPEMIDFSKKKKKSKKNSSKNKVIGILVAILVLLAAGTVIFMRYKSTHPTIDLSDYMEIQFEGYDGEGQIEHGYPCLDMDRLNNEIEKKEIENVYISSSTFGDIEVLKDGMPCDGKNLCEGDVLTLKLNCDPKYLYDETGIQFVGTTKEVKVTLNPLVAKDVFEEFTPQFTGTSPAGHLRTDLSLYGDSTNSFVSGCYMKYRTLPFDFYLNNKKITDDTWIAVGDVVEVRLNNTGESYLKDEGLEAIEGKDKKEITVTLAMFENGAWVTDPDKIDAEVEQELSDRMKSAAQAYAAGSSIKSDLEYVGMAYTSLKEGVNMDKTSPAQYFVYKGESNNAFYESESEYTYILVVHTAINEKVENAGAEDVIENPGETIQDFDRDEKSFQCERFSDVESLKSRFNKMGDRADYTMDSSLQELMDWNK